MLEAPGREHLEVLVRCARAEDLEEPLQAQLIIAAHPLQAVDNHVLEGGFAIVSPEEIYGMPYFWDLLESFKSSVEVLCRDDIFP